MQVVGTSFWAEGADRLRKGAKTNRRELDRLMRELQQTSSEDACREIDKWIRMLLDDRMTSLAELLRDRGREILAGHPALRHQWNADHTHLLFPAAEETGFDVEVVVARPDELIVAARGAHEHFPVEEAGASDACESALGLARDLLSPHMRLREHMTGGKPYRWMLDVLTSEGWETASTTGSLWFNYFGKRSERVYQNNLLPGRLF